MYLDISVKIPSIKGKITKRIKNGTVYIEYEYERIYDSKRKFTTVKRATIGKECSEKPEFMSPNQNYLKYFPAAELPEEKDRSARSCCLRIGAYLVISQIIRKYSLDKILANYFYDKEKGLFLDLVTYSIICENNAGQYYPDYAYNHPLFTERMKIYSDSKVSDFLNSMTDEQSVGFLNEWNEKRNHREKIYFSYDSTNKNCQAGEIEMVEYGHAKDSKGLPVFNYSIAYDSKNEEPLFYEKYSGSINDVSQFQFMLDKARSYGYRKIGFILDRGYFSKSNIQYMGNYGYSFIIMSKGMNLFVKGLIKENAGSFEKKRLFFIDEYKVNGKTVTGRLYADDTKDRYFHIYHSSAKESAERNIMESRLSQMKKFLEKYTNKEKLFGNEFEKYFELIYDEKTSKFLFARERTEIIDEEINLCGYFVIITSEKMTAREAIELYRSRDASEKLFRGDKSYLGNKSIRVQSDESASAKIFIEFVALIIRNKIYRCLKHEMKNLGKRLNYMTVPGAIKELEKIEMGRQMDNVYRLDHAVTANQKAILNAFGMDAEYVINKAAELSEILQNKVTNKTETNKEEY